MKAEVSVDGSLKSEASFIKVVHECWIDVMENVEKLFQHDDAIFPLFELLMRIVKSFFELIQFGENFNCQLMDLHRIFPRIFLPVTLLTAHVQHEKRKKLSSWSETEIIEFRQRFQLFSFRNDFSKTFLSPPSALELTSFPVFLSRASPRICRASEAFEYKLKFVELLGSCQSFRVSHADLNLQFSCPTTLFAWKAWD